MLRMKNNSSYVGISRRFSSDKPKDMFKLLSQTINVMKLSNYNHKINSIIVSHNTRPKNCIIYEQSIK